MQDFKAIAFGYSSAESERTHEPALLTEGHIDFKASTHEALYGSKYLFLGYKGAGKSTVGEHIQLTLSDSHDHFVRLVALSKYGTLTSVKPGLYSQNKRQKQFQA